MTHATTNHSSEAGAAAGLARHLIGALVLAILGSTAQAQQIDVDPESLSATLQPDQMEVQELTIANLGGTTLDWEVASGLRRIGALALESGEDQIWSAVIDPAGDFAYFATNFFPLQPAQVVKVDLATFERVGAITLASGEGRPHSAVIDPGGEFAYFGTNTVPGRVVKIDLETFERVGAITLPSGENELVSAAIDPTGDFAYFGTLTSPGRVVKIDLDTFQRAGAITLDSGENQTRSAAVDPAGDFAYFGMGTDPGRVVKIDLDTFERVDAITLASGENQLVSLVIEPTGDFAYFGTNFTIPGRVVKVDLDTFERVGAISLPSGEAQLFSAAIDPAGEFAYFGTSTSPGRVVKIDLETFARVGAITLASGENLLRALVIEPTGDLAYFGTITNPGRVVKIQLRGPSCPLPAWVSVDPTSGAVPGGGEQTVAVTFDATGQAPGAYEAALCLASNDAANPLVTVPLGLTVTAVAEPVLTFDPTSLDFGDVELGMGETMTTTLTNSGDGDATGLLFSSLGNGFAADTGDCGTILSAGQSCTVGVTFAPTATGPAGATLEAGSAEGATAALDLTGNGVSKTEVFSPVTLEVDYEPLASDGNRVFEPGEIVDVAPAWHHDGQFEQALSGTASGLTGPDGPSYDILVAAADYGLVFPGETASCRDNGLCYQMDIGPVGVTRPARHWDATFEETLSDETAYTWTLHMGDSFVDVPPTNLFYRFVETLLHSGVTAGCSDTQYCPSGVNVREQMAVFVLKAVEGPGYVPPPCDAESQVFADVPFDSLFCPWIEELFRRGVVAGCGGGNYCPGSPITRDQMAVFLLKTLEGAGYTPPACAGVFTDVACPSLFADWIEELHDHGITGGCSAEPLAYCPAAPVNREQMAVFVTKTFGLTLYGP
ncbi:MAG: choice-of-anchor D domain-containing protein [Thermoanaerobaculia bacterium]